MQTQPTAGGISDTRSDLATTDDILCVFISHREELTWLAKFLTGDDEVADACVIDASVIAAQSQISQEHLSRWMRLATVRSAFETQQSRIAQLALFYEYHACVHRDHSQLSLEWMELLIVESDLIRSRLDVLCRFALIMCGIEKCSAAEAAWLLRISSPAVESAYCAALESLDVIECQLFIESCGCGACN